MIPLAWKFNSKQLLCKTLNSRMNIIEIRAVLNIVQIDGKWDPEAYDEQFQSMNIDMTDIKRAQIVKHLYGL